MSYISCFDIDYTFSKHNINKVGTKLIWLGKYHNIDFTHSTKIKEVRECLIQHYDWMNKDIKIGEWLELLKQELIKLDYPYEMIEN